MKRLIHAVIGGLMTAVLWGYVFYDILDTAAYGTLFGIIFGSGFLAAALISLHLHMKRTIE